jgi:dolichol kinase
MGVLHLLKDIVATEERHLVALLLALGVWQPPSSDVFHVVLPLISLLGLLQSLKRLKKKSWQRFGIGFGVALLPSLYFDPYIGWWVFVKLSHLYRDALVAALISFVGLIIIVLLQTNPHVSKAIQRKSFHIIIVSLVWWLPAESILLGSSLGICLLLTCEIFRNFSGSNPLAKGLNDWFELWIDEKDQNQSIVLTHIYLIAGCIMPVFFSAKCPVKLAGIATTGVGDAMAAIVGTKMGKTKFPNSKKTLEGSVGMFGSMYLMFGLLCDDWSVTVMWTALVTSLREAGLVVDNLILPAIAMVFLI